MKRFTHIAIAASVVGLVVAGCGSDDSSPPSSLPQGSASVELDPADFSTQIDNPYWPMRVGSKWTYREGGQLVVVTVTKRTKTIDGIKARVVHDRVSKDGELVEDTLDWYAQDKDGNIWYLGEDTKEFENGKVVSTEGSWEHGVDGAQAGILVPAEPKVGLAYRQEYYEGEAEDRAEVLSLDKRVQVPFGAFFDCLQTKDTTPLEPDLVEHKFYAKGMGPVLAVAVSNGGDREELVAFAR
jgi:hypothetical protein